MSGKDGKKEGKILTIGGSMGVIIPKAIRTELGLELGTPVSMEVEDGAMMLHRIEEPESVDKFNAALKRLEEIAKCASTPSGIKVELTEVVLDLQRNNK